MLYKNTLISLAIMMVSATSFAEPEKQPITPTPATHGELVVALRESHKAVFDAPPSKRRLAMAWAQVAFENGGGRYVYNYNLGNVVPVKDQPYFYADRRKYRAFESFIESGKTYWNIIKRCTAAMRAFDEGAPSAATVYLKRCGYFEADLELYMKAMVPLYKTAIEKVIPTQERIQQEINDIVQLTWVYYNPSDDR